MNSNSKEIFISLLNAGLWEGSEPTVLQKQEFSEAVDWNEVHRLAEEQSSLGVVLAGIEHSYVKPPQEFLLQWIGEVQMLEQQNKEMNHFIAELVEKMRNADIYSLLVKGQGIAQCYERPLWRSCGDVDLFLNADNYEKTKSYLIPFATHVDEERPEKKHLAMSIDSWEVELHGSLRCGLWRSLDRELDKVQKEIFHGGAVRSWMNNSTLVFIPRADEDVVYVFSHILNHLFWGGVGLRQVCDWCRLLWTFRESLNHGLLESRIKKMGVMTEWKAFAALAVNRLGMPMEAMPFFSLEKKWVSKSNKILSYILEVGNFGHNIDVSYQTKLPAFRRKFVTLWLQVKSNIRLMRVFPFDSLKSLISFIYTGLRSAISR